MKNNKKKILEVKNLTVKYGDNIALDKISFDLNEGDFMAVIGTNGSGKSTLLKSILGLIDKKYISKKSNINKDEILSKKGSVRYLSQYLVENNKIFPAKVEEIIGMGLIYEKMPKKGKKEEINKVLKVLEIEKLKDKKIGELSGGERQKVLIARLIVGSPKLIILDEPLSSIDEKTSNKIYNTLDKLNNEGITIIMISHDLDIVVSHANKVVLLDKELKYFGDTKTYIECRECEEDF